MSRLRVHLKWLYPGIHVKRWVALALAGFLMFLVGTGVINQVHHGKPPLAVRVAKWLIIHTNAGIQPATLGLILTLFGAGLSVYGLGKLILSLTRVLDPNIRPGQLVDAMYASRRLSQGLRIVVIGGGTGLSTMLRGLKRYTSNITAIVTVADNGGSSGKLRKQLNILPPGDIRNCLVALADDETQMTRLFQYRFRNSSPPQALDSASLREGFGEGLRDHAFGNLLIAAMCAVNDGDFERAVQETSRVLNVRGTVLPSTVTPVHLRAEMEDGSVVEGEASISEAHKRIKHLDLAPVTAGERICPVDAALSAIAAADVVVLGPGSVYTSILPNLLVPGISEALQRSRALKVYVCNVMTQPGETDGFTAYEHVQTFEKHLNQRVFNAVLVNTGVPEAALLERYRLTNSVLVEADVDKIRSAGYRPVSGNFVHETDVVRHDAVKLSEAIVHLAAKK